MLVGKKMDAFLGRFVACEMVRVGAKPKEVRRGCRGGRGRLGMGHGAGSQRRAVRWK